MGEERLQRPLVHVISDALDAMQTVEPREFGDGHFYVSEVVISWGDGHVTEERGRIVPDDFEGYEYVPGYVSSSELVRPTDEARKS